MSNVPAVSNGSATTLSRVADRKLTMMLGDEHVAVRIGADGFLKRVLRKVRLHLGPELYIAKDTGPDSKVSPYQPGYMKIVAGMGGQLVVPPRVINPDTGALVANPIVTYYPGTAVIRSVDATAVCAVRDIATGEWKVSTGRIVYDTEQVFRQALLKLDQRDDAVQYLTKEEFDADKAAGKLAGWAFLAAGPIGIAYNLRNPTVKGAFQTFTEQSATARQRACSKAERLACDHNPATRLTWTKGMLTFPERGLPYVDVPVVAWVEHRDRQEMERFIESLASSVETVDGVAEIVRAESDDDGNDEIDEDYDPETPRLTDRGAPAEIVERQPVREPVVVDAAPAPVVTPAEPAPAAKPAATSGGAIVAEIKALEARLRELNADLVGFARNECGITDPLGANKSAALAQYRAALKSELGE